MKTALQEHIEWLEDTLSLAKEHAPILENCLKLCISDAKLRLEKEHKQQQELLMWRESMFTKDAPIEYILSEFNKLKNK